MSCWGLTDKLGDRAHRAAGYPGLQRAEIGNETRGQVHFRVPAGARSGAAGERWKTVGEENRLDERKVAPHRVIRHSRRLAEARCVAFHLRF